MSAWPMVKLGEVLTRRKEEIAIDELTTYSRLTIRLNGRGIVVRDKQPGSLIGTKKQFIARAGQLVLSKIDARNGAFGVLPMEADQAIITGNFWAFDPRLERLNVRLLDYLTKTPAFLDFCIRASEGTTNRRYLQEDRFLAQEIPLPPLAEQRRLVARIDALAAKIEEAQRLREEGDEETRALHKQSIASVFAAVAKVHKQEPLGDHVRIEGGFAFKSGEYQEHGLPIIRIANLADESVNTFGSPCMPSERLNEFKRFVLRAGDILIAMTGATTGKLGIVPEKCHNWLLNQRVGKLAPKHPDQIDSKYVYWLARGVQQVIFETAYGGAQPNISPRDIERMQFPFPPIAQQRSTVARLDAMEEKKRSAAQKQSDSAAALAALLPAILDRAFRGEM